jgi:hypothetical protein
VSRCRIDLDRDSQADFPDFSASSSNTPDIAWFIFSQLYVMV